MFDLFFRFFKPQEPFLFLQYLFFQKFRVGFFLQFNPLDPAPWIRIFLRIRIQEAKILRIQQIRILSTVKLYNMYESYEKRYFSPWFLSHLTISLVLPSLFKCKNNPFKETVFEILGDPLFQDWHAWFTTILIL